MSNEFLEHLKNRILASRTRQTIADFVCENTTLTDGVKFSFKDHKFQKQIMNDLCENVCVMKTAQCGVSEVNIRKCIALMVMNPGTHIMYTYPDLLLKKTNSQTRIAPLLQRDFPCSNNEKWIRNTDVMQIGDSFLYLASNSESAATSISLNGGVFNDEVDLSSQEFLSLVASRLMHAKNKLQHAFSTPTFSDYGISKMFDISNQFEYLIKCPHCGKWQLPDYDLKWVTIPGLPTTVDDLISDVTAEMVARLDLDNAYVRCEKCGGKLELGDDSVREWVAKYPERVNNHGYRVNCFTSNYLSIKFLATSIINYSRRDQMRRAYNVLLGRPYVSSATRLEVKDILACMCDERLQNIETPCFIGIDVGTVCTCVICTNGHDLVHFETVPFDKLIERYKELLTMYDIVGGVIDRHPQISLANELRDLSDGKIVPVIYTQCKNSFEPHKDIYGNIDYYNINRTSALDYFRDMINSHKLRLFGYTNQKDILLTHFRDNWRNPRLDTGGEPIWVKLTGADHYLHSATYSLLATKIYDYVNSSSSSDDRFCLGISGPASSILDSQNKTLYNENLLQYSKDIQKHKVKRLR